MTEFDKARREFTDEVAKALRIPRILDWMTAFIERHPWIERIPAPPKWMGLMFWIYACVAVQVAALALAYLTGHGR
jgi:hypothetical protein